VTAAFQDAIVVVTGGARGIGESACRAFAAGGASVAILDIDAEAADLTRDAIAGTGTGTGTRVWSAGCDIADEKQVEDVFARIDRELGTPDVLVNNAAINPRMNPLKLSVELWNKVLATNLTGQFLCSREAGRRMVERGSGAIVNVTSIAAASALGRGNFAYAVAKAGVEAATRELAVEWARHGVRVNAVAPCQVSTHSFAAAAAELDRLGDSRLRDYERGIPIGRAATPEEVAAAIVYLASDGASMVTGVVLPVDGGNLAMNAGGSIG